MREYTIHPLAVGINETDQGVMTYLRDYGKRIYLPIYAFYAKNFPAPGPGHRAGGPHQPGGGLRHDPENPRDGGYPDTDPRPRRRAEKTHTGMR